MIKFKVWSDIPDNFEGWCEVIASQTQYHLIPGRIIHNDKGHAAFHCLTKLKAWLIHNKKHRLNGPAVEGFWDGFAGYWIDDVQYVEETYWKHPLVVDFKLKNILNLST